MNIIRPHTTEKKRINNNNNNKETTLFRSIYRAAVKTRFSFIFQPSFQRKFQHHTITVPAIESTTDSKQIRITRQS